MKRSQLSVMLFLAAIAFVAYFAFAKGHKEAARDDSSNPVASQEAAGDTKTSESPALYFIASDCVGEQFASVVDEVTGEVREVGIPILFADGNSYVMVEDSSAERTPRSRWTDICENSNDAEPLDSYSVLPVASGELGAPDAGDTE
jgi:hypothetical protein